MLQRSPAQPIIPARISNPRLPSISFGKIEVLLSPFITVDTTAYTTATTSLNTFRTGGGIVLTFLVAKFIKAPAKAASSGRHEVIRGQLRSGAIGLLMRKAPVPQSRNCRGHSLGIFSPRSTRVSITRKSGENVTTVVTTSPIGRQECNDAQRNTMKAMYTIPRKMHSPASFHPGTPNLKIMHIAKHRQKSTLFRTTIIFCVDHWWTYFTIVFTRASKTSDMMIMKTPLQSLAASVAMLTSM
mmetsp:Transcript_4279/g.7095  ORF Transcript_4279/g.7095 Transcript_4279/m.7095 type:complete len:242 (-) Transcript_4279:49-774(-)